MDMRDPFGTLIPLPGEMNSGTCAFARCRSTPTTQCGGLNTSLVWCTRHLKDFKAGRLTGSLVTGGYRPKPSCIPT